MSLQPLVAWWPERSVTTNKLQWRQIKRGLKRSRRSLVKYLRSQYYLFNAVTDARRAVLLNEDIAWGSLMLMAILNFAAISGVANVIYSFVLAASLLSTLSGANLALLVTIAVLIVITLGLWLNAFLHNLWTYCLYEAFSRKQSKSLRTNLRSSLRYASQTATAWSLLLGAAALPGAILNGALLIIAKSLHLKMAAALSYLIGAEALAVIWAGWLLCSYSLLPQVSLLETHSNWRLAAARARQLVSNKGRLFTLSAYLGCIAGLGLTYAIALGVQAITHISATLSMLLLGMVPLAALNATMTMLYRKRRLARS